MSAVDDIAAYLAHLKTGGNSIDQIIFDELPNGEEMNATDELRRLLDERGVEYKSDDEKLQTVFRSVYGGKCAVVEWHDDFDAHLFHLTPEQAVEATLGRGTCEILGYDDGYDEGLDGEMYQYADPRYFLSCEHEAYGSAAPNYCPVCGRKVVDE